MATHHVTHLELAYPVPTARQELQRFLGMAGYCRGFCHNFSYVVHPVTNLLILKADLNWADECQHAFDSARSLLCHAPVLAAPDRLCPFKLDINSSAVGAGAVLLQEDLNERIHPVCYF